MDALAGPMNSLPKLVVSETRDSAPWGEEKCELVRGGLDGALAAVECFDRVVVWGSLTLSRALLEARAVAAVRLRTVPVFLGAGLSFAPPARAPRAARLGGQHRYPTGHVTTEYLLEE